MKRIWPSRSKPISADWGSLTLITMGQAKASSCACHDLCAGSGIAFITIANRSTCASFNSYLMTGINQSVNASRGQPDAEFVILDLFRNADDHVQISSHASRISSGPR